MHMMKKNQNSKRKRNRIMESRRKKNCRIQSNYYYTRIIHQDVILIVKAKAFTHSGYLKKHAMKASSIQYLLPPSPCSQD